MFFIDLLEIIIGLFWLLRCFGLSQPPFGILQPECFQLSSSGKPNGTGQRPFALASPRWRSSSNWSFRMPTLG